MFDLLFVCLFFLNLCKSDERSVTLQIEFFFLFPRGSYFVNKYSKGTFLRIISI